MVSRLRRVPSPLLLLLVAAAIVACAWIFLMPPLQGPDEGSHYSYTERIAEQHAIPWRPTTAPERAGSGDFASDIYVALNEGGFGALAGNLQARPLWTKPDETLYLERAKGIARNNGGLTSAMRNPPVYYLYEAAPYAAASGGSLLDRVYLMRLANVPLYLAAIVFTWLLAGELCAGWPRYLATAAAALPPQLLNNVSDVNPDILLVTEWAAALWLMALIFRRGPRAGLVAWLTAVCVLGALTHQRSLPLFLPAAIVVLLALARERNWRRVSVRVVATVAIGGYAVITLLWASIGSGSVREFLSYIWQFYLPKIGFMQQTLGPAGYDFRKGFVDRWFGTLAQLEVGLPHGLETALYWVTVGGLVALVLAIVIRRVSLTERAPLAVAFGAAVFALLLAVHLIAYRSMLTVPDDPIVTARYLLPLTPLFGLAIAFVATTLPRRAAPVFGAAALALLVCLQFESLGLLLERFYA